MSVDNTSGYEPTEYRVLLKLDSVERATSGGIYIPDNIRDKERRERVEATVVATGGLAFQDPAWGYPSPVHGDRVRVAKYAGEFIEGVDGEGYQLVNDKDILAIVSAQSEPGYAESDQPDHAGDGRYAHLRST